MGIEVGDDVGSGSDFVYAGIAHGDDDDFETLDDGDVGMENVMVREKMVTVSDVG